MSENSVSTGLPPAQGLYDPRHEHDACGIGFVANIKGQKSHDIIVKGIQVLINLTHRGACGCDPETGDGAGVLIQIPHKFFARECAKLGFTLPPAGEYGVGMVFLPVEPHARRRTEGTVERIVMEEGLSVRGWRDTPIDGTAIGRVARNSQPYIQQIFVARGKGMTEDQLERKLYLVRKRAEAEIAKSDIPEKSFFYVPSLSARTIIYKGLLLAPQIANFYPELKDPDVVSALCLVHQRFSTNTFPTWQLAHPYRYIAHNGEINTVRGNVNWMHARQSVLASPLFGDDIKKLFPIVQPGGSDSAAFDNALELLVLSGRSLPHAMAMLIPEAWAKNEHMNPQKRAFYEYHASLMEPWDGPAAIVIIGGGDTGADCLGTTHRQGARSVTQFELLPQPPDTRSPLTPWPLWPMQLRVESSHEEGGTRDWSVHTVKFTGDEHGNVRQLHAVRVTPKFEPLPGTEFTLEADLVLLAMGFTGPVRNGMIEQLGVQLEPRGNVAADANYMSSVGGVFAAGDMRRGQSLVVWAIAEGRKAAEGIDRYLRE
jgi:glutamate synthase domain-containing protein 1